MFFKYVLENLTKKKSVESAKYEKQNKILLVLTVFGHLFMAGLGIHSFAHLLRLLNRNEPL